jgi:hypothetical protein
MIFSANGICDVCNVIQILFGEMWAVIGLSLQYLLLHYSHTHTHIIWIGFGAMWVTIGLNLQYLLLDYTHTHTYYLDWFW